MIRQQQLRVVYSLLKPALRLAARFQVPISSLTELVRLGYYETLARDGLSGPEIAEIFGQTARHMRSLASRLTGDFMAAEKHVGVVRELEDLVARKAPLEAELAALLPGIEPSAISAGLARLLEEGRLEREPSGRLRVARRYTVMTSEGFVHRIDALNHYLDGVYRAVVRRLLLDERDTAMIKTITFTAPPADLAAYLRQLEGDLRRDLAALEEKAAYGGAPGRRFTLGLSLGEFDDKEK